MQYHYRVHVLSDHLLTVIAITIDIVYRFVSCHTIIDELSATNIDSTRAHICIYVDIDVDVDMDMDMDAD